MRIVWHLRGLASTSHQSGALPAPQTRADRSRCSRAQEGSRPQGLTTCRRTLALRRLAFQLAQQQSLVLPETLPANPDERMRSALLGGRIEEKQSRQATGENFTQWDLKAIVLVPPNGVPTPFCRRMPFPYLGEAVLPLSYVNFMMSGVGHKKS